MKRGIFIGLIIVLVFVVFFTGFFIRKDFAQKLIFGDLYKENLLLKEQNEDLKAQINRLQIADYVPSGHLPQGDKLQTDIYLSAKIFSTYPFNFKNQLIVDAGEQQGVKKSAAATVGENILLGQIVEVFKNTGVVRTIFDPNWQLSVRIGKDEINGLFQGGNEPKITLIEKPVNVGDAVYSAGSEFPYALEIGEISEIKESAGGIFKEAAIRMPYNVNDLREANIIINR